MLAVASSSGRGGRRPAGACPSWRRRTTQQSTGCALPAVRVSGGEKPPRVSLETLSSPVVISAGVTAVEAVAPESLTPAASSRPAAHPCAAPSPHPPTLLRRPGKYWSTAVFIAVTAELVEK